MEYYIHIGEKQQSIYDKFPPNFIFMLKEYVVFFISISLRLMILSILILNFPIKCDFQFLKSLGEHLFNNHINIGYVWDISLHPVFWIILWNFLFTYFASIKGFIHKIVTKTEILALVSVLSGTYFIWYWPIFGDVLTENHLLMLFLLNKLLNASTV